MSDNFTYTSPSPQRYIQALLKILRAKGENALYELLMDARCEIDASGSYSRNRWNAVYTTIYFYIPADKFMLGDMSEETKSRLIGYCDLVMPKNIGFDVMQVELSPTVENEFADNKSLDEDLEELSNSLVETEFFSLPDDVMSKGKEMMKVYLYLYVIENYIRLFVETVSTAAYGSDYVSKLNLTKSIRDTIAGRKRTESKNRWVSIRGDSDLFYLDFIELNSLIQNNWELFKDYFPDQAWISAKLNELYSIRNLVAHNSYVGEHERNILQVNFRSIVKQLKR